MNPILAQIAYGAGSLLLGVVITIWALLIMAKRHSPEKDGNGCLATFLCTIVFAVAVCCFWIALGAPVLAF